MSDGPTDANREGEVLQQLALGLEHIKNALDQLYDPAYGGVPAQAIVEIDIVLHPYELRLARKKGAQ